LTLYVRTPSKLPADISDSPQVTVIEGELQDVDGLKKAASSGAKIFVSFAGPMGGFKGTVSFAIDCCSVALLLWEDTETNIFTPAYYRCHEEDIPFLG
jgi:hypothetical protein